jgi:hypothetical protein
MAMNEPQTPRALETMINHFHQQLGSQERATLKPVMTPWEIGIMEHQTIGPMAQVMVNTTWYQSQSRPRSH